MYVLFVIHLVFVYSFSVNSTLNVVPVTLLSRLPEAQRRTPLRFYFWFSITGKLEATCTIIKALYDFQIFLIETFLNIWLSDKMVFILKPGYHLPKKFVLFAWLKAL